MSELRARGQAKQVTKTSSPERISVLEKNVERLLSSQPSCLILSASAAFSILLLIRILSAAYATIPDCDEVFNFWEPTHYLSHGYGLQTWEYSPVYAIRSWAYVGLHSIASRFISFLPGLTKVHEFYGLRCLLSLFCAYSETRLYTAVSTNINRRVGILYLVFTICSAGMFHSAAAFLPSTFAMYTTILGMAAFIDRHYGIRTVRGISWFALGGFLGWPFSMAMCIPFILEELFMAVVFWGLLPTVRRFTKGVLISLVLLGTIVGVDYMAYHKLEIVPLNIVLYNVFGGSDKGPNIYGTEPWWFYLANLSLNFNLLLPFSLVAGPLLVLYYLFRPATSVEFSPRMIASSLPFYLWLAIFTAQPHKEERFMFVAYPALCLNAAIAYHIALSIWGALSNRLVEGKVKEILNWSVLAVPLVVTALISLSRIMAIVTAYSAPLHIYNALPINATGNLCLAKEWYRFPSSYFLPDGVRAKFVKSAFDGLLPGEFPESDDYWTRDGTWKIPKGMNDQNKGDPSKYIELDQCDFLVESYFSRPDVSTSEPDLTVDQEEWESLAWEDFLDASQTPFFGRTLWRPPFTEDSRKWGDYVLLKRLPKKEHLLLNEG